MLKFQKSNILVLAAHPDDETLGCGGTLSKLNEQGCNIELLTFTDGVTSREGEDGNRNIKLDTVSSILGIDRYKSGEFPDNAMDSVSILQVAKFIEGNVKTQPDIIFTHFPFDLNIDHQIVTKACLAAFRPQHGKSVSIYSYYVPSATDYNSVNPFDGKVYIKLEQKHIDAKLKALEVYEEEMREYPHSRSYSNVVNLSRVWGSEVGAEYCEKFMLIREVI